MARIFVKSLKYADYLNVKGKESKKRAKMDTILFVIETVVRVPIEKSQRTCVKILN